MADTDQSQTLEGVPGSINRERIVERLTQLQANQEQVRKSLTQLQANLSAYAGAIEDCEYWLSILDGNLVVEPAAG